MSRSRRNVEYGSSPHARGTPPRHQDGSLPGRFIPACTGNAYSPRSRDPKKPVHPRMCGERGTQPCGVLRLLGSSPHTRGTRRPRVRSHKTRRFILACAGNACAGRPRLPQSAVHPRMCGECLPAASTASILIGPSPHVRGTRIRPVQERPCARFIPACAGNASLIGQGLPSMTVHPRIRGERTRNQTVTTQLHGSSPHTRGTRHPSPGSSRPGRFIPAYAGNARPHPTRFRDTTVHPRMRGER